MATVSEALAIAIGHHQAGRLQAAEQIYRQILAVEPNHADSIHLLGVLAHQVGQHAVAVEYITRAIGLNGDQAAFHNNLGEVYRALHRLREAVGCYRRALELSPDYAEAYNNLGLALKEMGKLDEAVACCRRTLELRPHCAEAHNSLGVALKDQGTLDEALGCYRRALELNPSYAEAHNNLGVVLQEQGKLGEAVACYRRALELRPDYAETHNNLGLALRDLGELDEAVLSWRRALKLRPDDAQAHNNLGVVLKDREKLDEAVACYRRALELKPDYAAAHSNLGNALREQGKLDEAVACCRRALELQPDLAEAYNNLGGALKERGTTHEALACYRRALELKPDYAEAHNNLGLALRDLGKPDEAVACFRRALDLKPAFCGAYNNLANAWKDQGMLDEAVACCRQALELNPDFVLADSNLLYTLMFCPGYDAQSLYEEHRRWNRRHAAPLARLARPHLNDRSPERRLRVGYVSPDFRGHPVGRFLLPLLEAHNRHSVEVFCYASVSSPDPITDRCRASADVWRDAMGLSDEQLADTVRRDGIDVLVDLTMHMAHNRMLLFARKPAPVQVTYLAYCGTTGLEAMDYRLTDPYLDPPGTDEGCYAEESLRLPETYWCYRPLTETPAVSPLPAVQGGAVTFGSLNNFCKASPPALGVWCRLLQAVPGSRLLLHAHAGRHRDRVRAMLAGEGVSPERVTFAGAVPPADYFQLYHRMDIGLDPFPYGGGTTTCDALWMGVPVVSLAGRTAVGRSGASILSNIGLRELIAAGPEQYVQIAAELARNLSRLSELRSTLRDRMRASPLMDAPRFARNVEAAYRQMWRRWCAT